VDKPSSLLCSAFIDEKEEFYNIDTRKYPTYLRNFDAAENEC
jgi:hypothetical protein